MISHKYKCIFIHIQRTAGTSIEKWIIGKDWWDIQPNTKHILASKAKEIYKDYWDDYFKFSFVRNPWDRVISNSIFSNFLGTHIKNGLVDINEYKRKYGYPLTLEFDHRFYNREKLLNNKHKENQVYGNILDEELDFIGKFENLKNDLEFIRYKLKINSKFNIHTAKNKKRKHYKNYYNEKNKKEVKNLYFNDIMRFGYNF